jgi:CRISPR/Cas system Type II protein with McrA/HNH and RuvC-like nuclease domain
MKICKRCGDEKLLAAFSKDSSMEDGLTRWCKLCTSKADAERYVRNSEKINKKCAEWRLSNAGKKKSSDELYRLKNKEKRHTQTTEWKLANPAKVRIQKHTYRARKNGGKLSKDIVDRLYKLQRGKCPCCEQSLGDDYHLDHITPLALGGKNIDSNIQLLRAGCNMKKQARHPVEYMQSKGFLL